MISTQQILGLDEAHLVAVGAVHRLQLTVKQAFLEMQADARKDGHDLQLVSSFRSFSRQASIWDRKWKGALPLNTLDGHTIASGSLTDVERMHAILLWSALPGGSRHHWGTDFDVYDESKVTACEQKFQLVTSEYEGTGPCAKLNAWIENNASRYGFYRPYHKYRGGVAPEPWHLSYKPIADKITQTFSVTSLQEQLIKSDILGLDTVLLHLHSIFERYTLNRGIT